LTDLKYVNDKAALSDWAAELTGYRDVSRKRAIQKLAKRGFSYEDASVKIDEVWDDSIEAHHARYLFEKLVKRHKLDSRSDRKTVAKVWRSLYSKGFQSDVIRHMLDEIV